MNLSKIKEIVLSGESDQIQETRLLHVLSEDPNVITTMLLLLQKERDRNKNLLLDSNAQLSRAMITLMDENYARKKAIVDRLWVVYEIKKHYLKWKDHIRNTFKIEGLP